MAKKLQQSELDGHGDSRIETPESTALSERYPVGCLTLRENAPPEEWPTSLQVGTPKWRAAIVNASCTPDLVIGAEWSEPYTVVDWLVMWRESVDEETGEVKRYPWLVLFCQDGSLIGTSSQTVPHMLARALQLYTAEQWKAGIGVKFRRRPNRAGTRSYHEMRVVS